MHGYSCANGLCIWLGSSSTKAQQKHNRTWTWHIISGCRTVWPYILHSSGLFIVHHWALCWIRINLYFCSEMCWFCDFNYQLHIHETDIAVLTHWGRHFTDDIFKCLFLTETVWISLKISLKFEVRIDNISALVKIMAWRRPGDKPLYKLMLANLLTHICGTRPQWINCHGPGGRFKNAYELLNLRALKIPMLYKNRIFQCMSKIFCVEFQRVPLKFHTKYFTHTLKDVNFIERWNFKSS